MANERPDDLTKILFLDIETVPGVYRWADLDEDMQQLWAHKTRIRQERAEKTAEEIYNEAGIFAEFGQIICIGVGMFHRESGELKYRGTSFHGDDEKDVLNKFCELLNKHYNTLDHWLCGHNGKEFDYPYIARRCVVNGVKLPKLLDIGGKKPWEVTHLDTMNMWKFGDYKHFTSLALLTKILNVPTPKDDITGADVARVYWEEQDLPRIVEYCNKDVLATAQVYLRMIGEPLIKEENIQFVQS